MVTVLSRFFIKNYEQVTEPAVRRQYGVLCGGVGIALNILLFFGKFFAGTISGSIAITADAFNNLSDAGSSLVTLIGFKLAEQKPDSDHPFGHGRIEYVGSFSNSLICAAIASIPTIAFAMNITLESQLLYLIIGCAIFALTYLVSTYLTNKKCSAYGLAIFHF